MESEGGMRPKHTDIRRASRLEFNVDCQPGGVEYRVLTSDLERGGVDPARTDSPVVGGRASLTRYRYSPRCLDLEARSHSREDRVSKYYVEFAAVCGCLRKRRIGRS